MALAVSLIGIMTLMGFIYALWLVKDESIRGIMTGYLALAAYPVSYGAFCLTLLLTTSPLISFGIWVVVFGSLWGTAAVATVSRQLKAGK